uniref:Fatty-acid amide hydrolase 1 n=1 Tax=Gasterosteus aculeatus aculeatus TaxID=481459 RepID=G3PDL4_GASAC
SAFILAKSLSELTNDLQDGSLSPEDVFYSYMEKTLDVNKDVNCCTGILLESFEDLKTVASKKEGLLYGVPVSIKENYAYKNHDSSCGVVVNLERPDQKDSVIVEVLKRQGAIPFVKTNLPQALLNYDCGNPIYGQTLHPNNLRKTPGGSSGGEGALVRGGGSVLGFGSDVGGSIRIPASFCGICGLKPTAGRLSSKGLKPIFRGQKSVLSSPGPMARDVDAVALAMQALLCDHMFALDPTVPPIPFDMQMYQSSEPLRIGYLEDDGYTQPSPSMARGVREVKALLEQAGHTLVPYTPLKITYAVTELLVKGLLADGANRLVQKLEGGPLDPCLREQVMPYYLPNWLKKTLSFLLKPVVSSLLHMCALSYTALYNLLTFPAGVVPVSTVTAGDEEELGRYEGHHQDHWDKLLKQAVGGSEGLPVAVQCVALPWQDELCLRFMKEVERLVQQSRK